MVDMIATTLVRSAARALALPLAVAVLAACAGPPAPAPTAAPSTPLAAAPSPTRAPTATAEPPPPTPTPAPRALTLWAAEEGPALEAVSALAADFSAGGPPVEVVARPPDGLRLSLATAELAGDPLPDLLWGDGEALAGLIADGRLQPLPRGLAPGDALPALMTGATLDDELWGAPAAAGGSLLLLYNRGLVGGAPATSDALIVAARAAETPLVAGLVMAWDEARWLLPWLYAFGGAPTSPDGMAITLDTPAMTSTLNLVRELYTAAPDDGAGYARGRRLLAQGYAAFAIDGEWSLPMYRAVSDTLDLGIAPLPLVPATGRRAVPTLGGTYLMLARGLTGEELERALGLVAFLGEPASQARLAEGLGRLPATEAALALPGPWASEPSLLAAAEGARAAPGLPPTTAARCALFGIDVWLPSLLRGSIPAAELPGRMQREAEACLARES